MSRLPPALWLMALSAYILAGVALTPFHGDEAMQITMSRDAFTGLVEGQWSALLVNPPYTVDSPGWLRLINGSINAFTLGLTLHLNGYRADQLPPLWVWPMSVEDNRERGSLPSDAMLHLSRLPSSLFLCLSVVALFAIGQQLGGQAAAYLASGLYALHPVLLLNGRRAMMEGSLLAFGLWALLLALLIARGRDQWQMWLALGVVGGLTLASKHSGVIYLAGAMGGIVVSGWLRQGWRYRPPVMRLALTGMLTLVVFIGLSPALWNDPAARLSDLLRERQRLLESQVVADPAGVVPLSGRVQGIVTQPFLSAPQYYEAGFWAGSPLVQGQISRYQASPWGGLPTGNLIGWALTALATWGGWVMMWPVFQRVWSLVRRNAARRASDFEQTDWGAALVAVWLIVTLATLLINPLPWQRYALPLIPLTILLAAIGTVNLIQRVRSSV